MHRWLDSWTGVGLIAVGLHRQGWDLRLTQYGDRNWRATFYVTGVAHSIVGGSACEATAVGRGADGGVGDVKMVSVLKGIVRIREAIKGTGITFPRCEFIPTRTPEITRIEIEAESGDDIQVTVHFTSVASEDAAIAMAQEVATEILDRLGFHFDIAIQDRQVSEADLNPANPTPGVSHSQVGRQCSQWVRTCAFYVVSNEKRS